jgi:hypothetical protein
MCYENHEKMNFIVKINDFSILELNILENNEQILFLKILNSSKIYWKQFLNAIFWFDAYFKTYSHKNLIFRAKSIIRLSRDVTGGCSPKFVSRLAQPY